MGKVKLKKTKCVKTQLRQRARASTQRDETKKLAALIKRLREDKKKRAKVCKRDENDRSLTNDGTSTQITDQNESFPDDMEKMRTRKNTENQSTGFEQGTCTTKGIRIYRNTNEISQKNVHSTDNLDKDVAYNVKTINPHPTELDRKYEKPKKENNLTAQREELNEKIQAESILDFENFEMTNQQVNETFEESVRKKIGSEIKAKKDEDFPGNEGLDQKVKEVVSNANPHVESTDTMQWHMTKRPKKRKKTRIDPDMKTNQDYNTLEVEVPIETNKLEMDNGIISLGMDMKKRRKIDTPELDVEPKYTNLLNNENSNDIMERDLIADKVKFKEAETISKRQFKKSKKTDKKKRKNTGIIKEIQSDQCTGRDERSADLLHEDINIETADFENISSHHRKKSKKRKRSFKEVDMNAREDGNQKNESGMLNHGYVSISEQQLDKFEKNKPLKIKKDMEVQHDQSMKKNEGSTGKIKTELCTSNVETENISGDVHKKKRKRKARLKEFDEKKQDHNLKQNESHKLGQKENDDTNADNADVIEEFYPYAKNSGQVAKRNKTKKKKKETDQINMRNDFQNGIEKITGTNYGLLKTDIRTQQFGVVRKNEKTTNEQDRKLTDTSIITDQNNEDTESATILDQDFNKEKTRTNENTRNDTLKEGNYNQNDESNINIVEEQTKAFHFQVTSEQWQKIKPFDISINARRKLEGPWTNIFARKSMDRFPGCVLVFKSNRVKAFGSRKTKAPFFNGKARCKGPSCSGQFTFRIEHEPFAGNEVEVFCVVEGSIVHFRDEINKREVKGYERMQVAAAAERIGSVNYYYEKFSETPTQELERGNISRSQTPSIIRKIVSESALKDRLHTDIIEELKLMKEVFENEDGDVIQNEIKGYIQEISADPFTVVLTSKEQIRLIRKLSAQKNLNLYVDATGSVIRRIPNQKTPYLYSIVVKTDENVPAVSVADMVTTQHTIPRLEFFMASLKRSVEMGGRRMHVSKIETDFSWVLIQSSLKTFNLMNVKQYLVHCYGVVQRQKERNFLENFSVLHLCSAHMIKDFSRHIHKIGNVNKKLRRFIMQCFARLQNCSYLQEAEMIFKLMCTVFGSKFECKDVSESRAILNKKIKMYDGDTDADLLSREIQYDSDEILLLEGKTIKDISPFSRIFDSIARDISSEGIELNELYCPEMLTILRDNFLPLIPLWSGLMLQPLRYSGDQVKLLTRDTNAPVEGWFKAVKHDIMIKKSHEKPSKFIIKLRKTLKGRLQEIAFPDVRQKTTKKKNLDKETELEISLKTEKWKRKRPKKPPVYHTLPKQKDEKVDFPQVPSWGGTIEGFNLINTCTIDNCLTILYLAYLEDKKMQDSLASGVYSTLLHCLKLMKTGNFSDAKVCWLEHTGTILTQTTDIYGDEFDLFVKHIQVETVVKTTSICNDSSCPKPYLESVSHGIIVSTNIQNPKTLILNDLLEDWNTFTEDCNAEYEDGQSQNEKAKKSIRIVPGKRKSSQIVVCSCPGKRKVQREMDEVPPILFLRIFEKVKYSGFPNDIRNYTGELSLLSATFRLVGATLYRPGHFTAVSVSKKHGFLFYDGLRGKLQTLHTDLVSDFTPSHLVFVRQS